MTIAELLDRGANLSASDAVSIVLSVIDACAASPPADLREPYGPPSLDNIELNPDGSIVCTGSATTPAVSEMAILLQALLARTSRVPGGLQYAIGRGLLEVEAPPFDSIDEFAHSIARFAEGDRDAAIRALFGKPDGKVITMATPRLVVNRAPVPPPPPAVDEAIDRRLHGPRSDQLRRELRAVDELLYARRVAAAGEAAIAAASPTAPLPALRGRRFRAWVAVVSIAAAAIVAAAVGGARDRALPAPPSAQGLSGRSLETPPIVLPESPARHDIAAAESAGAPTGADRPQPAVATTHRAGRDQGELVPMVDDNNRPVFAPSFASNASAVFFRPGRGGRHRAASMSADDDELRVMSILDDGAHNYHVQLSPDGRQIAFDSDRDGDRGVYIANRDGSNVHRVSGPGYAAVPTWSPDGRRLVFERAEAGNPRVWNLWLLTIATGATARLTRYQDGQPWAASWFPDGRRLAYAREDRLHVLHLRSGATDTFLTPVPGHAVRTPAVSPDGTEIAFNVAENGVWLLDLGDGSMRCALRDPTAGEFAWAPDGHRLAFHSRRDGQWGVYVMADRD